jgi:hypothetical protein
MVIVLTSCVLLFCCVSSFQLKNGWKVGLLRKAQPAVHSIHSHQLARKLLMSSEAFGDDLMEKNKNSHDQSFTIQNENTTTIDLKALLSLENIVTTDPNEAEDAINRMKVELPGFKFDLDTNLTVSILQMYLQDKKFTLKTQYEFALTTAPAGPTAFLKHNSWLFNMDRFEALTNAIQQMNETLNVRTTASMSVLHRVAKNHDISKIHIPTALQQTMLLFKADANRVKRILHANPSILASNFTELNDRLIYLRRTFPQFNITNMINTNPWLITNENASDLIVKKAQVQLVSLYVEITFC